MGFRQLDDAGRFGSAAPGQVDRGQSSGTVNYKPRPDRVSIRQHLVEVSLSIDQLIADVVAHPEEVPCGARRSSQAGPRSKLDAFERRSCQPVERTIQHVDEAEIYHRPDPMGHPDRRRRFQFFIESPASSGQVTQCLTRQGPKSHRKRSDVRPLRGEAGSRRVLRTRVRDLHPRKKRPRERS